MSSRLSLHHWRLSRAIALKNVRLKYKNSILGFFWSLLNPLLFLLIFTFIFGQVFSNIPDYPLYALTGLVFWSFFPTTSNMIIQAPVDNAGILKSLSVSPCVFPDAALLSGLMNFGLTLIPFGILMVFLGYVPDFLLFLIFPALLIYSLFVYGLSLALSALNVYFRDVSLLWNTLMPAIFYFTPVAYAPEMIPESSRYILKINPFYHFTGLFRDILYHHSVPATQRWLICLTLAFIVWIGGNFIYKKLQKGFISNF